MSKPMWYVRMVMKGFPYKSKAARLTRVPLLGSLLERKLFDGDDIMILPCEGVVPVGEEVAGSEQFMVPAKIVEHFIDQSSHRWIMNRCICRESMGCEDYPVDIGCLFLGEAVLGINPELGRLVSKEEAMSHLERARSEGLFNLVGRNRIDTVWLGIGPPEKLLTVCNCCPCCCLWTILPEVAERIGEKVTRMPGFALEVSESCTGCGTCAEGCYVKAIKVEGGRAVVGPECRGCGHCIEACPESAIELRVTDDSFVSRAIERISSSVDVR